MTRRALRRRAQLLQLAFWGLAVVVVCWVALVVAFLAWLYLGVGL